MSRLAQIIIFGLVVHIVYFFFNYFLLNKISKFFSLNKGTWFYVVIIILTLSFVASFLLDQYANSQITRIVHTVISVEMGIAFLLFIVFVLHQITKLFGVPTNAIIGTALIGLVLIVSIFAIINASKIHLKEVEIPIKGLTEEKTIMQLSDIHAGTIIGPKRVEKIVSMTNAENPDYVVITGDLVDGSGPLTVDLFRPLDKLNAPTYFVAGNHEHHQDINKVMDIFGQIDMTILRDEAIIVDDIQFIGVEYADNKDALRKILPTIDIEKNKTKILLFHAPDDLDYAVEQKMDLVLSGHTHSGQIWPFNFLVKLKFKYLYGLFKVENTNLYVSSGAGFWGPPMRLGSNCEIVKIKLVKA